MSETFSERLREERKRLGMSQEQLASIGGVQRGAQNRYESGERTPDADYLMAVAQAGVDVSFVLTGKPSANSIAPDEQALLAAYRALDARSKAAAIGAVSGLAQPEAITTSIRVKGDVGQYIEGNVTTPFTIDMSKGRKKRS
ncbi:helix-turn-helix domain-containing protein [Ralstonia mannitolilytica]|uniref:helix-turn-helix domain-containing protein n=1 Tax=Ralstonia mannitolilytica TaxID=105219 RepID=UPI001D009267|nr:helix-turn-helix transcriptional regulator [Ralstonia mannitolilytica]